MTNAGSSRTTTRPHDLDRTHGALGLYVAEPEIGLDGPIREHYLVTGFDADDESHLVTEICWPIFQTTIR